MTTIISGYDFHYHLPCFFSEEKIMMNDVESFPAFDDDDCDLCSHVERGQESI